MPTVSVSNSYFVYIDTIDQFFDNIDTNIDNIDIDNIDQFFDTFIQNQNTSIRAPRMSFWHSLTRKVWPFNRAPAPVPAPVPARAPASRAPASRAPASRAPAPTTSKVMDKKKIEEPCPNECVICQETPKYKDAVCTDCNHYYCKLCWDAWMSAPTSNHTCPTCRKVSPKGTTFRVRA